jgi:glycosyltransferase involved in cell wall biosynthesis
VNESLEADALSPGLETPVRTTVRTRTLRVCTVAYTFYESDGRVMRYSEALRDRGDVTDVIALRQPGRPRIDTVRGVRVTGVQTRKINERSPRSYLGRLLLFFLRTTALLTWRHLACPYDLVHIHSVPDFLVFTAWLPKLLGAKVILDIHDILPELYASKFGVSHDSPIFKALLFVERVSASFADHIISANDLWQETLVRRSVAPHKATVLLNFPDRSIFYKRGRTRADGKFVMIYPGTLNRHQGVDIAIEAFAKIKDYLPYAELHICGSGPALSELTRLVSERGLRHRVHFKGMLPLHEIAPVIENADLGLVPKRNDSFGNEAFSTKILEFMAMGVPVIVSDTKIDRYYFNDALVKFFRAGNVDDLASRMLELSGDPTARSYLIENGLQFIQENSWQFKKKLYLELVNVLVYGHISRPATQVTAT